MTTPTQIDTVLGLVKAAILAISPTHLHRQEALWTYVEGEGIEEFRRFRIHLPRPAEKEERPGFKIWGNGQTFRVELEIVAGYGALPADHDNLRASLVTYDTVDLYKAISGLMGTADNGITQVDMMSPHHDIDEDAGRWRRVTFRYELGYQQATD